MKIRLFTRWDLQGRWKVKLTFQPDWQIDDYGYRHAEFGDNDGYFELWSKATLSNRDHCVLDKFVGYAIERVRYETVWTADHQTGKPVRQEKTYIFPIPDLGEKELVKLTNRLKYVGDHVVGDERTMFRLQRYIIHTISFLEPGEKVDYYLVRAASNGRNFSLYTDNYSEVSSYNNWPENYTELAVLLSSTPTTEWRSVYALFPIK